MNKGLRCALLLFTSSGALSCSSANNSDVEAPTVPAAVMAPAVSSQEVQIVWSASTDDSGVAEYMVYRDGVIIGLSNAPSFTDTDVEPGASYCYAVSAVDEAGNESAHSTPELCLTTLPPDTELPSTPQNVLATPTSTSEVSLMWSESLDDRGVAYYEVYRDDQLLLETAGVQHTDLGLHSQIEYCYDVAAVDQAGNRSARSETSCGITKAVNHTNLNKLIGTGSELPDGSTIEGCPAISDVQDDRIVFHANQNLYDLVGGEIRLMAKPDWDAPGGRSKIGELRNPIIDGPRTYFTGTEIVLSNDEPVTVLARSSGVYVEEDGIISLVVDTETERPDVARNYDFVIADSAHDRVITIRNSSNYGEWDVPWVSDALFLADPSGIHKFLDLNDENPDPDNPGKFSESLIYEVPTLSVEQTLNGATIVRVDWERSSCDYNQGCWQFFQYDGEELSFVASSSMTLPNDDRTTALTFVEMLSAERLVFKARKWIGHPWSDFVAQAHFLEKDGDDLRIIYEAPAELPDTRTVFYSQGSLKSFATESRIVEWLWWEYGDPLQPHSPFNSAIFAYENGEVRKLLNASDSINGVPIRAARISGMDGDVLYITDRDAEGNCSIFSMDLAAN